MKPLNRLYKHLKYIYEKKNKQNCLKYLKLKEKQKTLKRKFKLIKEVANSYSQFDVFTCN